MFGRKKEWKPLVLCFFGDGPYWSDFLYLNAYPTGTSYLHPFRYNSDRVQQSIKDMLDTEPQRKNMIKRPVFIGSRFVGDHSDKFLPIRMAEITYVDTDKTVYLFDFRLGHPFDYRSVRSLDEACLDLSGLNVSNDELAFEFPDIGLKIGALPDGDEPSVWRQYIYLLSSDQSLPIATNARKSLYFHISLPFQNGTKVPIKPVHKSANSADIYGTVLKEGQNSEFKLSYGAPYLDKTADTVEKYVVDFELPTDNINLSSKSEDLIGNYGTKLFLAATPAATGSYEKLLIKPQAESYLSQNNKVQILARELPVPIRVESSVWYRLRSRWLPNLILYFAFVALALANQLEKLSPKIIAGTLTLDKVADNWILLSVVAIGSGFATIIINKLKT